jgi:hypothetical protein
VQGTAWDTVRITAALRATPHRARSRYGKKTVYQAAGVPGTGGPSEQGTEVQRSDDEFQ